MQRTTVGQFLVNDVLPQSHQLTGPITNKGLHDHVVDLAKTDPVKYVQTVQALKRRGDEIATLEGVSVGLDDIEPLYAARDEIQARLTKALLKTPKDFAAHILATQDEFIAHTKKHPSTMTQMALSGARGNIPQLMKIVATPLATVHPKTGVESRPIKHSYSEGLTSAEFWRTLPEVRANEVAARISVSEPGEMAKVLVNNMISKVVTISDCGTNAGLRMRLDDGHIVDRYSQEDHGLLRNTVVTPRLIQELTGKHIPTLLVRSPMTCGAPRGVCQHCQGLSEKGQIHTIGMTVGVRAAQALAEPLTQMTLSSRHASLTIKGDAKEPAGLKGVRQYLDIPKAFRFEAVLAPKDGVLDKIEVAPQGGHYLHFGREKLYSAPDLKVTAHVGQHFERGDTLTDGVPHPAKIVDAKGIGAGREYFVNALHRVYKNEGINVDKRHVELLAKSEMNHVRLLDADAHHPELLKGDIINYNAFKDAYAKEATRLPIEEAVGYRLGQEVEHHTVGTILTPRVTQELKSRGIKDVLVNKRMPNLEFVMKPLAMNPLLESDWMARLSHRYLKDSIHKAVQMGEVSDIHGTHPVPAYAFGAELRHGPQGTF